MNSCRSSDGSRALSIEAAAASATPAQAAEARVGTAPDELFARLRDVAPGDAPDGALLRRLLLPAGSRTRELDPPGSRIGELELYRVFESEMVAKQNA